MNTGYENAPATKLVETRCLMCNRPLVDAESLTIGIGPICRKKAGYDASELSEDERALANQALYNLAAGRITFNAAFSSFGNMGWKALQKVVLRAAIRRAAVIIHREPRLRQTRVMLSHYNEAVQSDFKRLLGGRAMKGEKSGNWFWYFPTSNQRDRDLFKVLKSHFSGQLAVGDKGPFTM